MTYNEVIKFMFRQLPMFQREGKAAYKNNLDNTLLLDNFFNNPHKNFKSIHIAGTNGKGSVSHILASVLQKSGLRVGLYTSPHLKSFRERIKIDGKKIGEKEIVDFISEHIALFEQIKPSFFEITVALAFYYFAKMNVDIAVVEVGMGGRLDSTNIIKPILSIITNIGYDHTDFLGNTLQQIAKEKAGIIKKNVPVLIGETHESTEQVFVEKAEQNNSEILFADKIYKCHYSTLSLENEQLFHIEKNGEAVYNKLKSSLLGIYQRKNIITCIAAIEKLTQLNIKISKDNIYEGILKVSETTGLLGRWQIIGNNPLIVCDTAHNIDGIKEVLSQIATTAYKNLHIVFGVVNDKNVDSILDILPKTAQYYFTKANIPRSLDENILLEKANKYHLRGKSFSKVKIAVSEAKKRAETTDFIFIGGSTFVVAEVI